MGERLSRAGISIILGKLKGFTDPNMMAEQYEIPQDIAGNVLWHAFITEKVRGHTIADLGCGTGFLGILALIMGAKCVYFVDFDKNALKTAKSNLEYVKSESSLGNNISGKAVFLHSDVANFDKMVDLVLTNPPFGTKVRHADREFLVKAFEIAPNVYTFSKSECKNFIYRLADKHKYSVIEVMDFAWPLKMSMKHHRKSTKKINVSCFVLEKGKVRLTDI